MYVGLAQKRTAEDSECSITSSKSDNIFDTHES